MKMSQIPVVGAFVVIVGIGAIGYGEPYIMSRKTDITEREIVIARGIGFGTTLTYAKNLQNGDEKMLVRRFVPFIAHVYYSVDFSGRCKCIEDVYRSEGDEHYYVSWSDDKIWLSTGKIFRFGRWVPAEQVQDKLNQAKAALDDARNRFADILPK